MRARGRQALIALKLASLAFLLPVRAGTAAQAVVPVVTSRPAVVRPRAVGRSGGGAGHTRWEEPSAET